MKMLKHQCIPQKAMAAIHAYEAIANVIIAHFNQLPLNHPEMKHRDKLVEIVEELGVEYADELKQARFNWVHENREMGFIFVQLRDGGYHYGSMKIPEGADVEWVYPKAFG